MSALGAAVGKGIGAVGGPQVAALVVAGGLIVGALGGGFIAGGQGQQATTKGGLAIYPCPDSGPALATVGSGQKFLVTGKNADASWVRIYYPLPDRTEAWVTSGPLQIAGSIDALPVVPCSPVVAGAGPAGQPGASLTAIEDNSPSPAPPSSGPSSPPTPPPNGAPVLARLAAAPGTIAGGPQRYCANTARAVTVSVRVTDAQPIASVVLSYRRPGLSGYATKPMNRGGGASTWQATLRTDTDGIDTAGDLRFFVSATDSAPSPRTARLPADGAGTITVAGCVNKGPTFASVKASPGTVFTNLGACANNRPVDDDLGGGDRRRRRQRDDAPLPPARRPGRPPGGDDEERRIVEGHGDRRTPRTRTRGARRPSRLSARDATGKTARSSTRSFKVTRCNYPAVLHFSDSSGAACPVSTISLYFMASDRDGLCLSGRRRLLHLRADEREATDADGEANPYDIDQDTKGTWIFIFDIPGRRTTGASPGR